MRERKRARDERGERSVRWMERKLDLKLRTWREVMEVRRRRRRRTYNKY